jgi:purine-binding chemotaxis protein CheW
MDDMELDSGESQNIYLTFVVADETYAVNIQAVTTIVGMQHISGIPDLPDYVKGVMNLRGKVIPVIDLRLRFGLPWQAYDDRTTIIVLNLKDASSGLVVDKVTDVVTISPEKITPPPNSRAGSGRGVILGVGKLADKVCIILDMQLLVLGQDEHMALLADNSVLSN